MTQSAQGLAINPMHRRRTVTGAVASLVILTAVTCATLVFAAAPAQAAGGYYCGASWGYIPGYTNCPQEPDYFVTLDSYNQATTYHPNDGDYVCETIEDQYSNWISRKCGQNQALSGTVYDAYLTEFFVVGNDSPNPHYVDGYWAADF